MRRLAPPDALQRVNREVERSVLRARNGIRYVAGASRPQLGVTPKDVVWQRDKAQLWRYRSPAVPAGPPVLLVHSLVSRSYILDLRPGSSTVEFLRDAGFDVFLLDWGIPDELDAENTLETYIDEYLTRAITAARRVSGSDAVTLAGYCLGGVLALLHTAARRDDAHVRALVTMATPIDFSVLGPLVALVREGRLHAEDLIDETGNVPPAVLYNGFRALEPTDQLVQYVNLWQHLWNDQFMDAFQAISQWGRDHIPFPGAAFRQVVEAFVRRNELLDGGVDLGAGRIELGAIRCPVLNVMAEYDKFVPMASSQPLAALVGGGGAEELRVPSGHVGFAAGRHATKVTLPMIAEWVRRHGAER